MSNGNREYRSDVFSMLLMDPVNALSVYNALNNSELTDPSEVSIETLERGISLSVRNDAAFVVDSALSIYEHQSTVCRNMPLRSLIYYVTIIRNKIKDKNIYGSSLIKVPTPKFVVFYNGETNQPEQYEMKLSDAFEKQDEKPQLELVCKVYNINYGKNEQLLNQCGVLKDYSIFVKYVRYYFEEQNYEDLELAINKAIDRCIEENILSEFLRNNRDEVVKVTQLDYTFDRQIELEREEAKEQGRAEGREQGRAEGREKAREEDIIALITYHKEHNSNVSEVKNQLVFMHKLNDKMIDEYIKKYWK